ncbi:hypothetical protein HNQ51_003329 [Inhella inkyongensis]|uniref:UPF0125 protein HNQ51_003329 n=2 Tax=Inhella inkyongensis TaxID=392593 RepID=A0A840S8Z5_9BURK|nr:RnfH family protein [Inhella inkyongensis]MBB5205998.1 hypothetical protein [Inhella inkyongensis]
MLQIELCWSPAAQRLELQVLSLPPGSLVRDALAALPADLLWERVGVWGHKVELEDALTHGDRVEVYRGLTVDPMEARRRRLAVQGRPRASRHRPQRKP